MKIEEQVLVPAGVCDLPVGRFIVDGEEVGVYKGEEERQLILHEINEEIALTE